MKISIENVELFNKMLKEGEIKTEWSMIELYGVDTVIGAAFEEYLNYEGIGCATHKNKDVLEAYLYDGVAYKGIHVDRAYIHQNGDLVLMNNEGEKILIIENQTTSITDFNNPDVECAACGMCEQ